MRVFRFFHDAYRDLPAATWLLAAAGFINRSGAMVLPFLQIYLGERFHYSFAEAGLFGTAYGAGAVLGSLAGGVLCDRLGPVRLQIAVLAATGAWFWGLAFVVDPWLLGAGLFVLGALNDAFRPGNFTAAVESCAPELRAKALTLNRLALNAGWAIGPAIGGLLATVDFSLLFFADGITCVLAALFLFHWRHRLPQHAQRDRTASDVSPWRDRRFLVLSLLSVVTLLVFLQSVFTQSRHMHEAFGIDKAGIGLLLMINPLLIVFLEMPLVHALRYRRRLPVISLGVLLVGVGLALLAFQNAGVPAVVASILVVVLGEMLWMPMLAAHVSDLAPAASRGRYLGFYAATISVATVLAPWLGGVVYDGLSPAALWLGCGLVAALAAMALMVLHAADSTAATGSPPPPDESDGRETETAVP